ncbi:ABC transporter substrate-binding protein [Nocardioides sp. R-C-SC26]|uniref:ABC transporter substrate-binding protein n=1 Tax=Nocardioides sp. R-C-SC26 TaxID=2870414 RepID=UPI001E394029|nr:ABC transporter substrate-binding protein [Nocardioides sp. R-C-SC26]
MTTPRRLRALLLATPLAVAAITACAPAEEKEPVVTDAATATDCVADVDLTAPGVLTVATDSPAYDPWFTQNDPTNGEGYESAVAYAVADKLGFSADQVAWKTVRFNASFAPGEKDFDFDINQISITEDRRKAVDFSTGYYSAAQAVIALADSPVASATTVAELADYNLGAQTGTTSLTAIRDIIKPANDPSVFQDTNAAKQALMNGQVDAILADLPTAFYITAVEIPKGQIIGQFQPETGEQEEFGLLLEKGSALTPCVDLALDELRADGTLAELEKTWLSDTVNVPELQ